jgi:hypothetical protein
MRNTTSSLRETLKNKKQQDYNRMYSSRERENSKDIYINQQNNNQSSKTMISKRGNSAEPSHRHINSNRQNERKY